MLNNPVMKVPIVLITFLCCSIGCPWLYSYQHNNYLWAKPQPTLYEVVYTRGVSFYDDGIEALRSHLEEQLLNEEKEEKTQRFLDISWTEMFNKMNPWYKPEELPLSELAMKVATLRIKQLSSWVKEFLKSKENQKMIEDFFLSFLVLFLTGYELGSE